MTVVHTFDIGHATRFSTRRIYVHKVIIFWSYSRIFSKFFAVIWVN